MKRLASVGCAAIAVASSTAVADPTQLGAWLGPRVYSTDSELGYIADAPAHPSLENGIVFGARVARPFFPWLVPEFELAMSPTRTNAVGGAAAASVFWMNPRLHVRFELMPERRFQPFVLVGGGAPVALSSARRTFDSGIVGDGYIGAGVRFDSYRNFILRFDARVAFLPGVETFVTPEVDIGIGIELQLGKPAKRGTEGTTPRGTVADRDGDGIGDAQDQCIDRAEDADGVDDRDGCPDIDNDLDRVLDIADRCSTVPETYNGFQDDDGCPDTLPPEIDSLRGTVEGLLYAEGETLVRDSAKGSIANIAKIMTMHPTIRVVLIGHTDDREAKQFATTTPGEPPPDIAALSADLSRARAEAVKEELIAAGISAGRVDTEGRGSEESVSDNDTPRGRLANRRVEIKLYVPPSAR